MVYGKNLATCFSCGKNWIVGDCIPPFCDDCKQKKKKESKDIAEMVRVVIKIAEIKSEGLSKSQLIEFLELIGEEINQWHNIVDEKKFI